MFFILASMGYISEVKIPNMLQVTIHLIHVQTRLNRHMKDDIHHYREKFKDKIA